MYEFTNKQKGRPTTQNDTESLTEVCELPRHGYHRSQQPDAARCSFQNATPFFFSALRELLRIAGVQKQNINMDHIDDVNSVSSTFARGVRGISLGDPLSYLKPSIY
jgi:hypothetical protein